MEFSHVSVLLHEAVDSLQIKPDGIYVDCTAGGGGHSKAILEQLTTGHLIAIDRDPDAIAVLKERLGAYPNAHIVHDSFDHIKTILGDVRVDGILADLGVSSYQLDNRERGFSFHADAPLDMRMSKEGLSAKDVVNTYSEAQLSKILWDYGEEKFAKSIARHIVEARENAPIETTFQLIDVIRASMPQKVLRESGHPARKTFQALRIEVNEELTGLDTALDDMFSCLKVGGILSIITFHSLEDRMVKQRFQSLLEGCTCPKEFPVCVCGKTPCGKLCIKKKGIAPSEAECENNKRARSARLRSISKLKDKV